MKTSQSKKQQKKRSWSTMMILTLWLLTYIATTSYAQDNTTSEDYYFIVNISGVDYTSSQNILPCFPLNAYFQHSNPNVTKIKMQYPLNPNMYKIFPMKDLTHIKLHENFMKQGEYSFSDFIALDDHNNEYGTIRLTFIPPYNPKANACDFVTS